MSQLHISSLHLGFSCAGALQCPRLRPTRQLTVVEIDDGAHAAPLPCPSIAFKSAAAKRQHLQQYSTAHYCSRTHPLALSPSHPLTFSPFTLNGRSRGPATLPFCHRCIRRFPTALGPSPPPPEKRAKSFISIVPRQALSASLPTSLPSSVISQLETPHYTLTISLSLSSTTTSNFSHFTSDPSRY
jgi:hypothetical protein